MCVCGRFFFRDGDGPLVPAVDVSKESRENAEGFDTLSPNGEVSCATLVWRRCAA